MASNCPATTLNVVTMLQPMNAFSFLLFCFLICQNGEYCVIFFNLGLSRPLFGFLFFLGSSFIIQLTNFDNGDRKQERRRKCMLRSIPHSLEKAQRPARIDWQQFWAEKSQVCPGIRTRLTQTECHCSTTCATTAAIGIMCQFRLVFPYGNFFSDWSLASSFPTLIISSSLFKAV